MRDDFGMPRATQSLQFTLQIVTGWSLTVVPPGKALRATALRTPLHRGSGLLQGAHQPGHGR